MVTLEDDCKKAEDKRGKARFSMIHSNNDRNEYI